MGESVNLRLGRSIGLWVTPPCQCSVKLHQLWTSETDPSIDSEWCHWTGTPRHERVELAAQQAHSANGPIVALLGNDKLVTEQITTVERMIRLREFEL